MKPSVFYWNNGGWLAGLRNSCDKCETTITDEKSGKHLLRVSTQRLWSRRWQSLLVVSLLRGTDVAAGLRLSSMWTRSSPLRGTRGGYEDEASARVQTLRYRGDQHHGISAEDGGRCAVGWSMPR